MAWLWLWSRNDFEPLLTLSQNSSKGLLLLSVYFLVTENYFIKASPDSFEMWPEFNPLLSSPNRANAQMVCSSMCGPVQLSLTILWATNRPKHPRPLFDSRSTHLILNPSPLTLTLCPSPPSASLSLKPLLTFWQSYPRPTPTWWPAFRL